MINLLILCAWLVVATWLTTISMGMLSAPNTIENLMGVVLFGAVIIISIIITKHFLKIKSLWKK